MIVSNLMFSKKKVVEKHVTFLQQRYYVWPNWLQLRDKNLFSISFCQRSESQRSHSLRSIQHVTFYLSSFLE